MRESELPGSVGAVSGDTLESLHAQDMWDYIKLIPGVAYNDQGTESSVPLIRGIGTEIGFGTTPQTTGVYLDDMPLADLLLPLSLPDVNPFDLERVEVLKGPQGTLFGSGALAGAVRYLTRPAVVGAWEGKVEQTVSVVGGNALDRVTAGAINVPVIDDDVAVRAVGVRQRGAGLYDMSATDAFGGELRSEPDADRLRSWSGRGLVNWRASDRLNVTGLYFRQSKDRADQPLADQPQAFERSNAPFPSPRHYEFDGANATLSYDVDSMRLLSSTNRVTKRNRLLTHSEWFFGLENQDQNEWYDLATGKIDGWTQEFRLLSPPGQEDAWLIGLSFLRYRGSYFQYEPEPGPVSAPPSGPDDVPEAQRAQAFLFATIDSLSVERAVFGELTHRLGTDWELTGGLRLYRTRMVADTVLSGSQIVLLTQQTESRDHFEPETEGVNPKAAVRYLLSDDLSIYALASKGFQFGGVQVNPSAPILAQSATQAGFTFGPYDSSRLWNYEVGLRARSPDATLRFELTAFYLDWRNLQLTVRVPISGTNATYGLIANVARAHSRGFEAAVDWMPLPGLHVSSSGSWIHAVTDVPFDEANSAGPVPAGTRLPGTPILQWTNGLTYERPVPYLTSWKAAASLLHSFVGSSPDAIRPTGTVGGYRTYDAWLTLSHPGSSVEPQLSFGLANLTDEQGPTFHSRLTSLTTNEPVDFYHFVSPRTAIVSVGFRY